MVLFLLTIFFGWTGIYRFSKKQFVRGFLYLFTFGLFYIGWFIDVICALKDMVVSLHKKETAPPVPPPPAPGRPATPAEELRQYKQLLDSGAITREEYERKKRELLDPDAPSRKFVTCAYCGTRNERGAVTCSACGAKLEAE